MIRLSRRFASSSERDVFEYVKKTSRTTKIVLVTTGVSAGFIVLLMKTSRLPLIEYARSHKSTTLKDYSWRDCLAVAMIDLYRQQSGPDILKRRRFGRFLGRWIADPKVYRHFSLYRVDALPK